MNNKVALVTGGSRGLGRDMAINIAKKGIDVVLTYNSSKDKAEEVVSEIKSLGQKAFALQLDTSDIKSFDGFFETMQSFSIPNMGNIFSSFVSIFISLRCFAKTFFLNMI